MEDLKFELSFEHRLCNRDNGGQFDICLKHRKGIGVTCIGMGIFGLPR